MQNIVLLGCSRSLYSLYCCPRSSHPAQPLKPKETHPSAYSGLVEPRTFFSDIERTTDIENAEPHQNGSAMEALANWRAGERT
jgi:hypothetical protein